MRTRGLSAKYKVFEGASSTRRLGSGGVRLVGASLSSVVGCRLGCLKQSELCLGHPIGDGMHNCAVVHCQFCLGFASGECDS